MPGDVLPLPPGEGGVRGREESSGVPRADRDAAARTPHKSATAHVKHRHRPADPLRMEDRSHILERAAGVQLPADYRKFLNSYGGGAELADGTMRLSLATPEVLAAPFPFDEPRMDRPLFEAHFIYLGRMRDAGVLVFEGAVPVSPDKYAKMITIGFGERPDALDEGLPPTHVVVLDPADGSVRLVPIDPPAVVRRVGDSFAKWFRAASKAAKPAPAKKMNAAKPRAAKAVAGKGRGNVVAKKAPARAAKKEDALAALKKKQKLSLPAAVERRLRSKTARRQVVTPAGRVWDLATPEELAETSYRFTEQSAARPLPFVRCTRSFADLLQNGRGLKAVPVAGEGAVADAGPSKKKFTLARLRKGVTIGASHGDPLFLDPTDKYSVWTYAQDTATVQRLADSFEAFAKPRRGKAPVKPARDTAALKKAA